MYNLNKLIALKARGKQASNSRELLKLIVNDYSFKQEIASLYYEIFKKQVVGCNNCYADAFFELTNLIKEGDRKMDIEKKFVLKRGVLLYDQVNLDASKMLCFTNLTDELALYHLATNPECVKYFNQLPDDWQKQVNTYKEILQKPNNADIDLGDSKEANSEEQVLPQDKLNKAGYESKRVKNRETKRKPE